MRTPKISFPLSLAIYVLLFASLTFPYWLQGQVIAPYQANEQLGLPETANSPLIENRKFGDYWEAYIPAITELMSGKRSGWLVTWTNMNELGRPTYHLGGFSPAYSPSWILAKIDKTPERFFTVFSLNICFLAGVFVLLLCRELGHSPLAGLVAASCLAASPGFMYWLTFPMFAAAFCWAFGALYAVTHLARKPNLLGWAMLTFATYSMLMTAYPQMAVLHAYLIIGYVLYVASRLFRAGGALAFVRYIGLLASAVLVGCLLALPSYLDIAYAASQSARSAAPPSFFTIYLPRFDSFIKVVRGIVIGTLPQIFGNPVSPAYPLPYDVETLVTPLVLFLSLFALVCCWRKTWGWWLAIIALVIFACVQPLYVFAVRHLGFNISRDTPLDHLMLPLTLITAYGADALVKSGFSTRTSKIAALVAAACVGFGVLGVLIFARLQALKVQWPAVLVVILIVGLMLIPSKQIRPLGLVSALIVVGVSISFPLMLRQPLSNIARTSPLVEAVRSNLPSNARFAIVGPGVVALPPNYNASVGLASIHTYDSLSSWRYRALIESLGGKVATLGRLNTTINPDFDGPTFWMSDIALVLSAEELRDRNLAYLGKFGGVRLYKVNSHMGCCLQIFTTQSSADDGIEIDDPRKLPASRPLEISNKGDLLEFDLDIASRPSLFILGQKFHRDWRAHVLTPSGWTEARTVPVDRVFEGVLLPSGAQRLRLEFVPFVRLAWISNAFWLLLAAVLGLTAMRTATIFVIRRARIESPKLS